MINVINRPVFVALFLATILGDWGRMRRQNLCSGGWQRVMAQDSSEQAQTLHFDMSHAPTPQNVHSA
jgi:hypothetical protein